MNLAKQRATKYEILNGEDTEVYVIDYIRQGWECFLD